MLSKSHSVPKPLWDALDSVLQKKAKELIKDIAKACGQPEKKLLDAYKAEKHTVHLLELEDPTDEKFECCALCSHSRIHTRCRKTVLYGKKYCQEHEFHQNVSLSSKPVLQRCITEENDIVFLNKDTSEIYNAEYKKIGLFINNRILLFEIEGEIEYI